MARARAVRRGRDRRNGSARRGRRPCVRRGLARRPADGRPRLRYEPRAQPRLLSGRHAGDPVPRPHRRLAPSTRPPPPLPPPPPPPTPSSPPPPPPPPPPPSPPPPPPPPPSSPPPLPGPPPSPPLLTPPPPLPPSPLPPSGRRVAYLRRGHRPTHQGSQRVRGVRLRTRRAPHARDRLGRTAIPVRRRDRGARRARPTGHRRPITGIAAGTIDGRPTLFSADRATIRRWDAATGAPWPAAAT